MERTRTKQEEIAYWEGYQDAMKEWLLTLMGKSERLDRKISGLTGEGEPRKK